MIALVHTQYLENYGDAESPFWKFKGGASILIPNCDREQDAMGKVCKHLFETGRAREEYPTLVTLFQTEEEAIQTVEEWLRPRIQRLA